MSKQFTALCELEKITEEQFFRRELNLKLHYKSADRTFSGTEHIIVSDNPRNWTTLLDSAPGKSLLFILIGNETYEPWKYEMLNEFQSIRRALLYNPPRACPYSHIFKSLLGNILDGGLKKTGRPGSVFRDFRSSQFTRTKLSEINIKYSYLELPQGYCNSFVTQLSLISKSIANELSMMGSLYSPTFQSNLRSNVRKTRQFSYLGQFGNHRRSTCLRVAQKEFGIDVPSKVGFGGRDFDGDSTYLNNLLDTKFPLVPPGAFNNYNHRYSESLITGGLPAILAQNSLDPSSNRNWTGKLPFPASHSFRFLLRALDRLSDSEFMQLWKQAFDEDFSRVKAAREFLHII